MSKQVKIVHLTSVHKDGDIRIFQKECVSLAEMGHDVTFVVPNAEERVEKVGDSAKGATVKIASFKAEKGSRIRRMLKVVNMVYRKGLEVDGDVYHLHDPELLRIALKLKRKGKIVIYDAHEDLPRQLLSKPYLKRWIAKPLAWFIEKVENKKVRKLDAVVAATPFIRDRFLKINPNTVDINNYPLEKEIETETVEKIEKEKAVCYIGGISGIRGIIPVIKALEITQVPLYLAGEMPVGLREELKQMEGWKYVRELGFISREEALEIKAKCMAGIVTFFPVENHVNAQPNKIFEYMASGLPVIGSDFPMWRKIIEDYNCGICVDPTDENAVASAITAISENPKMANEMGNNGRKMVVEKFNWNVEKEKLADLYAKLIDASL